jgi:hypothetical protein
MGVIEYSKYLVQMSQKDAACVLLNKVKQWYEKDDTFTAYYDEICN